MRDQSTIYAHKYGSASHICAHKNWVTSANKSTVDPAAPSALIVSSRPPTLTDLFLRQSEALSFELRGHHAPDTTSKLRRGAGGCRSVGTRRRRNAQSPHAAATVESAARNQFAVRTRRIVTPKGGSEKDMARDSRGALKRISNTAAALVALQALSTCVAPDDNSTGALVR